MVPTDERPDECFPSRARRSPHLATRQYARIVHSWVREIGLDANSWTARSGRDEEFDKIAALSFEVSAAVFLR